MFHENNLPHELLLTTIQKKKKKKKKKIAVPLAKNVFAPLGITAAASAIDVGIEKKYMVLGVRL